PIDFTLFQVGDGGVAAVVGTEGGAYSESALGEIEAVAGGAADAIVLDPANEGLVDAALIDEILEQAAYGIIGEGGDHGSVQAEAAFESAHDIVFAAAFADFERARGGDALFGGVEANHDFAEADQVPAALLLRFYLQDHARSLLSGNGAQVILAGSSLG